MKLSKIGTFFLGIIFILCIVLSIVLFLPYHLSSNNILLKKVFLYTCGVEIKKGEYILRPLVSFSGKNCMLQREDICVDAAQIQFIVKGLFHRDGYQFKGNGISCYIDKEKKNKKKRTILNELLKDTTILSFDTIGAKWDIQNENFFLKYIKAKGKGIQIRGNGTWQKKKLDFYFIVSMHGQMFHAIFPDLAVLFAVPVQGDELFETLFLLQGDIKNPHIRLKNKYFEVRFK